MDKGRLEAFSDGVIAILITIMVLELGLPRGANPAALVELAPIFLGYALSFVLLATYWNNHHHMLQAIEQVNGRVLWANMHLLFWLSLVPFATNWMGETAFATWPVAVYGVLMLLCAVSFYILLRAMLALEGPDSVLAIALGNNIKGKISPVIYIIAIPLAFVATWIACALYVAALVMWLIPDRRIENRLIK